MTISEVYAHIGADYDDVKRRLVTDERIAKFYRLFGRDPSFEELKGAMESGDVSVIFRAAHTLKGIAANLGLTALMTTSSELCEATRGGSMPDNVVELFNAVSTSYETAKSGIELLD